jgi:hypothetical protein
LLDECWLLLHPDSQGAVCDSFAAGHYDTAVLEALELSGEKLMRLYSSTELTICRDGTQ